MKIIRVLSCAACLVASSSYACITTESENNDNETDADGPLCSDVTVEGTIGSRRDQDWYYFNTAQPGQVDISLSHASADDFDWDLYQQSGGAVASGATSANPENGTFTGPAGDYFVKVTRYAGTGWYDLTVSYGDDQGTPASCATTSARPPLPAGLASFIAGNTQDVCPTLPDQGAVLLMGGGSDVDASFSQRIAPHINGGDIVVLRTTGTDAYNAYLMGLTGADSVETLIVDSPQKANSAYVDWAVRNAEFVFIAGGDQSDYLNQWQGTGLQQALNSVYSKHGVIGGTSAGNAVQGEFIYDPDGVLGAISDEVVTDYCHETMMLSQGFLSTPVMTGVITDTHFAARDRMGRMAVMLAKTGVGNMAIGVDEATALFVTDDGTAVVDGSGKVYVLTEDASSVRTQTACNQPVILENWLVHGLQAGDTFNVISRQSSVSPYRLSIDGSLRQYYSPRDPY